MKNIIFLENPLTLKKKLLELTLEAVISMFEIIYEKCVQLKTKIYELITLNWPEKNLAKQC